MSGTSGWTAVTAITAGAASFMAVVLGIEQLTSGSRLRNLEAMVRAAQGSTDDDGQRRVLASLHATTIAWLVARDAVPGWKFAIPAFLLIVSFAGVIVTWLSGTKPSDFIGHVVISTTGAVFLGGRGLVIAVNLARERARVARCYRNGVAPIRAFADLDAAWESGGTAVLWRAHAMSFGLVLGVCGVVLLFSNVRVLEPVPFALVTVAITALTPVVIWFGQYIADDNASEPRSETKSLKPTWSHPALSDEGEAKDQGGSA